jgi:hypothetical protein
MLRLRGFSDWLLNGSDCGLTLHRIGARSEERSRGTGECQRHKDEQRAVDQPFHR